MKIKQLYCDQLKNKLKSIIFSIACKCIKIIMQNKQIKIVKLVCLNAFSIFLV